MKNAWRRTGVGNRGRLFQRVFCVSFCLLLFLVGFVGEGQGATWDVNRYFTEAETARKAGQATRARDRYEICLNLARIDGAIWQKSFLVALDEYPELLDTQLFSTEKEVVPLTTLPEGDYDRGREDLFPIPVSYGSNDFLAGYGNRRLVEAMFRDGNDRAGLEQLEALLQSEPDNLRLMIFLGYLYEKRGRLDLAWDRYEEALGKAALEEDRFSLLYSLFRIRFKERKVDEAQGMLRRFVDRAQEEMAGVGRSLEGVEHPGERELTHLIAAQRRLVLGLNLQGLFRSAQGDLRDAGRYFEEALRLNPGRIPLRLNVNKTIVARNMIATAQANLQRIQGVLETVIAAVARKVEHAAPGSAREKRYLRFRERLKRYLGRLLLRRGLIEYEWKRMVAARRYFEESLVQDSTIALSHFLLGEIERERAGERQALVFYRQALSVASEEPKLSEVVSRRIEEIFQRQAKELEARKTLESRWKDALENEANYEGYKEIQEDLGDVATLVESNRYPAAERRLERLVIEHPEAVDAWLELARVQATRKKLAAAIRSYRQLLKEDEKHARGMGELAELLLERSPGTPEALALVRKAAELEPRDPVVLAHLAYVLFRLGNVKSAIRRYGEAVALAPKDPEYHYQLGMVYFRTGLHAFALKKFDEVLELKATHGKARLFSGLALARLGRTREALLRLSEAVEQIRGSGRLMRRVVETIEGLKQALERGGSDMAVEAPLSSTGAGSGSGERKVLEGIAAAAIRQGEARRGYELALAAIRSGRRDEAREHLRDVVKNHERYNDATVDSGFLALEDGDVKTAERSFNLALDFNPADRRANHGLADVYFRTGRLIPFRQQLARLEATPVGTSFSELMQAAALRWKELLEVSPADGNARFCCAQALFFTYALDEAVEVLEGVKERKDAQLLLAQIHLRQYVHRKSEVLYHRARTLLGQAGYPFDGDLPDFYEAVNEHVISEMARRLEEEEARLKKKKPENPLLAEFSHEVKDGLRISVDAVNAKRMRLDQRRWKQFDDRYDVIRKAHVDRMQQSAVVLDRSAVPSLESMRPTPVETAGASRSPAAPSIEKPASPEATSLNPLPETASARGRLPQPEGRMPEGVMAPLDEDESLDESKYASLEGSQKDVGDSEEERGGSERTSSTVGTVDLASLPPLSEFVSFGVASAPLPQPSSQTTEGAGFDLLAVGGASPEELLEAARKIRRGHGPRREERPSAKGARPERASVATAAASTSAAEPSSTDASAAAAMAAKASVAPRRPSLRQNFGASRATQRADVVPRAAGLLREGLRLSGQGRLVEAVERFRGASVVSPMFREAYVNSIAVLLILERDGDALRLADAYVKRFGAEARIMAWRGLAQVRMGDLASARRIWMEPVKGESAPCALLDVCRRGWLRILQDAPRDGNANRNLAFLEILEGKLGEARERLDRAAEGSEGMQLPAVASLVRVLKTYEELKESKAG